MGDVDNCEQLEVVTVDHQQEQQFCSEINHGTKWDSTEEEQLLKEVGKGLSIDEIAGIHKRKRGGIISKLKVITARMVAGGTPLGEACAITGTNYTDCDLAFLVTKYKNEFLTKQLQIGAADQSQQIFADDNVGAKWTKNEVEQLLKEVGEGLSIHEIADKHKRLKGGIISRLKVITAKMVASGTPLAEACAVTGTNYTDRDLAFLVAKYSKNKNEKKVVKYEKKVVNNETYPPILKQPIHKISSVRRLNANAAEQPSLKDIFALLSRIERKLDDIEQKI